MATPADFIGRAKIKTPSWAPTFGPGYEKPCKRENTIACSMRVCQKAGECQTDWFDLKKEPAK